MIGMGKKAKRKTFCIRGHKRTPKNLTPGGACRLCKNIAAKIKYEATPEKQKVKMSKRYAADPEKDKAKTKARRGKKPETAKKESRACKQKERDELRQSYIIKKIRRQVEINAALITPELIEIKCLTIKLQRSLKCRSKAQK